MSKLCLFYLLSTRPLSSPSWLSLLALSLGSLLARSLDSPLLQRVELILGSNNLLAAARAPGIKQLPLTDSLALPLK